MEDFERWSAGLHQRIIPQHVVGIRLASNLRPCFAASGKDGKKMDGKKMDGKKMDGKKMDGKKMDGKKMDSADPVGQR